MLNSLRCVVLWALLGVFLEQSCSAKVHTWSLCVHEFGEHLLNLAGNFSSDPKMSNKPIVVVNSKRRRRSGSSRSSNSDCSPPPLHRVQCQSSHIASDIPCHGGYSELVTPEGDVRDVYGFPTTVLSPGEREAAVKSFVRKLYHLEEGCDKEVENILSRLAPNRECKRRHLIEPSRKVNTHAQNVISYHQLLLTT